MLSRWLAWLRNEVDFPIRQVVRLTRPGVRLPAEPKADLFGPEAVSEVRRLVTAYGLDEWERESGRVDYAASLFYLQMLERAFTAAGVVLPPRLCALDAGCGDWFYVRTLYGLLRHYGSARRDVALDGVELDAYRPYAGFHSRRDWALAFAGGLPRVSYLAQDLRTYRQPVDIAFLLFPFLFAADLRRWGLPRRYLRPAEVLAHVAGQVRPGGWLVIANLGEAERTEQHRLLEASGLTPFWWGSHGSALFSYPEPRFVTVVRLANE